MSFRSLSAKVPLSTGLFFLRALLRIMTYEDKASHASSPPYSACHDVGLCDMYHSCVSRDVCTHVRHVTHACMRNACAIALRIHVWHLTHACDQTCSCVAHDTCMHAQCVRHCFAYSCVALDAFITRRMHSCVAPDAFMCHVWMHHNIAYSCVDAT